MLDGKVLQVRQTVHGRQLAHATSHDLKMFQARQLPQRIGHCVQALVVVQLESLQHAEVTQIMRQLAQIAVRQVKGLQVRDVGNEIRQMEHGRRLQFDLVCGVTTPSRYVFDVRQCNVELSCRIEVSRRICRAVVRYPGMHLRVPCFQGLADTRTGDARIHGGLTMQRDFGCRGTCMERAVWRCARCASWCAGTDVGAGSGRPAGIGRRAAQPEQSGNTAAPGLPCRLLPRGRGVGRDIAARWSGICGRSLRSAAEWIDRRH